MSDEPDLAASLDDWINEVVQLRMGIALPGSFASTAELLDVLLDVRRRLDRVEELYGNALRLRAHALRRYTAARITADDAWDAAAVRQRQSAVRDEYSSAKERTAATNLEVLDVRRVERTADRDARRCDEAVEFIRLRHRGIEGLRQDLMAIIKARQFESALDR